MELDSVGWLVGGAAAGAVLSRVLRRSNGGPAQRGADPQLLPDPALDWLRRVHGAVGVWISEPAGETGETRWSRAIAPGSADGATLEVVERRLALAMAQGGSGAERLEQGTLLFGTAAGVAAGMVLPADTSQAALTQASEDLLHLLEGAARRPILTRLEAEGEHAIESLGSIGLRLAYQLERILDAEVIVAASTDADTVKVIGVSGRADRRLVDTLAVPASPLFQVTRGEVPSLSTIVDPLGGMVPDRRSRFTPAIVLPIKSGQEPVGAVAFWTDDEAGPIAPVIAEVQEALRSAGPRIARAREFEASGETATSDPLTGLKNRRGLEDVMGRLGVTQAALVYCDLDKFKRLNDALGHPAGDAALVHFARLVNEQIRGGDTAARIGGEEFAIWLPNANLTLATRVADRIRVKLGTTPWDWQGRHYPLGASFGVAAMPDTTRSIANLEAQADAALLLAKREGRNRVETAARLEGQVG